MQINCSQLKPKQIWRYFYLLTTIPRSSKKEEKVQKFILDFGEKFNLETIKDEVGNIIIKKPATPGMENLKTVVLQAHLDMVCEKNKEKIFDFDNDSIETIIDENSEWVTANGTTLGADNGIGVASILAILESSEIVHGPIEALFTIDEETGLTGVKGLKAGLLKGEILLNLDSEEDGVLCIGCAGGIDANIEFYYTKMLLPSDSIAYEIKISGLKGGHSGVDINLGRGNANKILNRLLLHLSKNMNIYLHSFNGGNKRNAIPREASAVVVLSEEIQFNFIDYVQGFLLEMLYEISPVEPDLKIETNEVSLPGFVIDPKVQFQLLNSIYACPNGVVRMSSEIKELVETSINLATVETIKNNDLMGKIKIGCMLRSSVDSARENLEQMVESVFTLSQADEIKFNDPYPGWKPNPRSQILNIISEIYHGEPKITAIHAGLETGMILEKYPTMDMISFGPTILHPHSPDEKVNIKSVENFWNLLLKTLENIPEK